METGAFFIDADYWNRIEKQEKTSVILHKKGKIALELLHFLLFYK